METTVEILLGSRDRDSAGNLFLYEGLTAFVVLPPQETYALLVNNEFYTGNKGDRPEQVAKAYGKIMEENGAHQYALTHSERIRFSTKKRVSADYIGAETTKRFTSTLDTFLKGTYDAEILLGSYTIPYCPPKHSYSLLINGLFKHTALGPDPAEQAKQYAVLLKQHQVKKYVISNGEIIRELYSPRRPTEKMNEEDVAKFSASLDTCIESTSQD